jgi:hypothetical protein
VPPAAAGQRPLGLPTRGSEIASASRVEEQREEGAADRSCLGRAFWAQGDVGVFTGPLSKLGYKITRWAKEKYMGYK